MYILTVRTKILSLLTLSVMVLALDTPVVAKTNAPKVATIKQKATKQPAAPQIPWMVNCATTTGRVVCAASQRLTIKKTGQLLLGLTFQIPPKSKSATMMLQLPLGMFLPDGVAVRVDRQPAHKEPIQTCNSKGCYVGMAIDSKFLKSLKTGKSLSITFKNLQKKEITIPISLAGFKEAYQKLL